MENQKMIKTAKNLHTFTKVCGKIFFAFSIVCIVMMVFVGILGEKMIAETSVSLGFVKLYLSDEFQLDHGFVKAYIIVGLIAVAILCFVVHYTSKIVLSILEPMQEGRPFDPKTPKNLRKIAWIVLVCGAVIQIIQFIECALASRAFNLEALISSDAVSKMEINFTMNLGFIIVFIIIMFSSYIFSYGQHLQKESDETL